MNTVFVFDLDCTITKREILPLLASLVDKEDLMQSLTDSAMINCNNFKENFLIRLETLKDIPLKKIQKTVLEIEIFPKIADFIESNKENCYILTGNLDLYVCDLVKKLGMENHCFSSIAQSENGKICSVTSVINKGEELEKIKQKHKRLVCIGDGTNDIDMIKKADIGIAFSAVHKVCDELMQVATHNIDSEDDLCNFLKKLI
ncbi:MAG: HAD-IB family phosphatase [Clostridia bacterium]